MKFTKASVLILSCTLLSACVSQRPRFTGVEDSLQQAMDEAVMTTASIMAPEKVERSPGSLWQKGSNQFFKDPRARQVGDIVTVLVEESTKAKVEAKTETDKAHSGTSGITNLLNFEGKLASRGILPGVDTLLNTDSNRTFAGDASTDRNDTLNGKIAAVVTQVMPNGYLVIKGRREVMVNYEMQEMMLTGIIRPADITPNNTIESQKIAEARIAYTGKGIIDENQVPNAGVRWTDKLLPF